MKLNLGAGHKVKGYFCNKNDDERICAKVNTGKFDTKRVHSTI